MTSSLVGSEMCIRDSLWDGHVVPMVAPLQPWPRVLPEGSPPMPPHGRRRGRAHRHCHGPGMRHSP
eukprot:12202388-Prorocentrum_lima.AAC.1